MTEVAPDENCLLRRAKDRMLELNQECKEEALRDALNFLHN